MRLSAGLLLLAPQIPMLFMGEEYGETHPFPYFCSFEDPGLAEATRRGRRDEFIALGAEDEVPDPLAVETFESAKLSWSWTDGSLAGDLRQIYYDLLAIRRYWLPLRAALAHESYLLESWHEFLPVVRLTRQAGEGEKKLELTAWFNLSRQPQTLPEGERPEKRPLLCSEDWRYGGSRAQEDPCAALLPFEFWIMGPVMEGSRLA